METYTVHQVSRMLGVCPETVRRWVRSGDINSAKACRKDGYIIPETELSKFLISNPKYGQLYLQMIESKMMDEMKTETELKKFKRLKELENTAYCLNNILTSLVYEAQMVIDEIQKIRKELENE